jgi:hypothetical protein
MREDQMVSPALRTKAHILGTNEVCWGREDIEPALFELAQAGQVILGFDILELLSEGSVRLWGTSSYDMDSSLRTKPWDECVRLSYELARKDVADTQRLTGLPSPLNNLWYCVVTADQLSAVKLKPGEIWVEVRPKKNE